MGIKNSNHDNVLTIPRRDPVALLNREHRPRTARPDSRRGNAFPSRLPFTLAGEAEAMAYAAKTRGEIEAAICAGISRLEQEFLGRGPSDIRAHLIGDLLLVRLSGVLTLAERKLSNARDAEKGRDLVKQVRTHLIETARPVMKDMVENVAGVQMISLHHDLSTVTGEEFILVTLAAAPRCRETTKKEN